MFAFLKRSGAKDGLVSAKRNKADESENGAEKEANSFLAKGKGFSICSFFFLQIEISFLDKHS